MVKIRHASNVTITAGQGVLPARRHIQLKDLPLDVLSEVSPVYWWQIGLLIPVITDHPVPPDPFSNRPRGGLAGSS